MFDLFDLFMIASLVSAAALLGTVLVWFAAYLRENPGSATAVAAMVTDKVTDPKVRSDIKESLRHLRGKAQTPVSSPQILTPVVD
jgi:hypothetical protein